MATNSKKPLNFNLVEIKKVIGLIKKQIELIAEDSNKVNNPYIIRINKKYNECETKFDCIHNPMFELNEDWKVIQEYLDNLYISWTEENEWIADSIKLILNEMIKNGKSIIHLDIEIDDFRLLRKWLKYNYRISTKEFISKDNH